MAVTLSEHHLSADRAGVTRPLEVYRARIRRARRTRYVALSLAGVGAVWLVTALLFYLDLTPPALLPVAISLTGLLPVVAVALEVLRRPTMAETAALLDSRLDNRQRLVTSIELLNAEEARDPQSAVRNQLHEAQIATTSAMLARTDPRVVLPARTPWGYVALGVGLLFVALGVFIFKGGVPGSTLLPGSLPDSNSAASSVPSPTPQSGLPEGENQPTPPPASEQGAEGEGQEQAGQGQAGQGESATPLSPEEAERRAQASRETDQALQRLSRALNEQSVTQGAADSLRQGNHDEAARQLAEVGQESDQLSDAAKRGLSESLDKAAAESSAAPDLQRAEEDAADALAGGDYSAIANAMKSLGEAIQRTGQDVVPQQELAKDFPEQSDGQKGEGSEQGKSQSGQDSGQSGQEGEGSGSEQPNDQNGDNGEGSGQGENEGGQDSQGSQGSENGQNGQNGQGQSGTGAAGDGTRVQGGRKATTDLDVEGNPFELESARPDPGQTRAADDPDRPPGLVLEGGGGTSQAGPVAPGSRGTAPGESNSMPVERWGIIQKYFSPDGGGE